MTKIGVGQAAFRLADMDYNLKLITGLLEEASGMGVEVLVLPEMANTGYSLSGKAQAEELAEEIPNGPLCRLLANWSRPGRLAVSGICEKEDGRYYTASVAFGGGQHLATYRKLHLFGKESQIFTPGADEPPVFEFAGGRYGLLVCYDWVFPEVFRLLALKGAQAVLLSANLVLPYCQGAMVTRAIENRFFTVLSNRIGPDGELNFRGESQIITPQGQAAARAGRDFSGVLAAEVDLTQAEDKMITPFNHVLRDRRVDMYGRILERD